MIKNVGILAEGTTDFIIIKRIVMKILKDEAITFHKLWPEDDCRGRSTGWKGVWDFCITELRGNLSEYMNEITPKLDLIIIHLDGDVAGEPEIYCPLQQSQCDKGVETNPLNCELSKKGKCPQPDGIPTEMNVQEKNTFLGAKIDEFLGTSDHMQLVKCIPCDSIETWIVCAYEGAARHNPPDNPIETIKKPADSIIGREPYYFAIRVERVGGKLKKQARLYINSFAPIVAEKWAEIITICEQAKLFEDDLRTASNNP